MALAQLPGYLIRPYLKSLWMIPFLRIFFVLIQNYVVMSFGWLLFIMKYFTIFLNDDVMY